MLQQEITNKKISIHTDGSCRGNPGPGGWGVACLMEETWRESFGASPVPTTNNRMELEAGIAGLTLAAELLASHPGCEVILYSDSSYFVQGTNSWAHSWKARKFHGVKNPDLWKKVVAAHDAVRSQIEVVWEKGHADSEGNNRADELARKGSKESYRLINNKK